MNTLFNKVLGENEQYAVYFYLKDKGTFGATLYIYIYVLKKNVYVIFFSLQVIKCGGKRQHVRVTEKYEDALLCTLQMQEEPHDAYNPWKL